MLRSLVALGVVVALGSVSACSDDTGPNNKPWPDGLLTPDGSIFFDFVPADVGLAPDLSSDPDGPTIEVLAPKPGELVLGSVLKVQAKITDPDVVDDQTVQVTLKGSPPSKMSLTATPSVYEAVLDVSAVSAGGMLWVEAWDLKGKKSSKVVTFTRDPGPKILITSPAEGSRHRASVSVQVVVFDTRAITAFDARIGSVKLPLQKSVDEVKKQVWVGNLKFDDKIFSPALRGEQVITVSAENENKARTTAQRTFVVDDQGPVIVPVSHKAGNLIGGIITLRATVTDEAGVLPSSVVCVVGNNVTTRVVPLLPGTGGAYQGSFDTRTLDQHDLWPVLSFRAADKLGNDSHADIQVGLDNGQPILELDPPADFRYSEKKDGKLLCSEPFDPVGCDAVNDLVQVPQIAKLRVRVEDQGNDVPSAQWFPVSGNNQGSVKLFVLDDTSKPLVIDSDEDGWCDSINPEVIPTGANPQASAAVAVDMTPVGVTGKAFFPAVPVQPLPTGCSAGTDDPGKPPEPLCPVLGAVGCASKLTVAIRGPIADAVEPALYVIPPVDSSSDLKCVGLPFDFKANSFQNGWVCAAATGEDGLGNRGISPPLRLFVNLASTSSDHQPLPSSAGTPPNCTGTLVKATGQVNAAKPCNFRPASAAFSQRYWTGEIRPKP